MNATDRVRCDRNGFRVGVVGVLCDRDRVLMVRRAAGIPKPGFWCFPGGHVEPGETHDAALRREIHEELNITVRPLREIGSVFVRDSNHLLSIWLTDWHVQTIRPAPREIDAIRWVPIHEISVTQPGLPSNLDVYAMLTGHVVEQSEPAP